MTNVELGRRNRRALGGRDERYPCWRALAGHQITLGAQLRIGLQHHSARDPERGRERPRGRQPRSQRQATAADVVAQRVLQLLVEGRAGVRLERHEQLRPGNWLPVKRHNWTLTPSQ